MAPPASLASSRCLLNVGGEVVGGWHKAIQGLSRGAPRCRAWGHSSQAVREQILGQLALELCVGEVATLVSREGGLHLAVEQEAVHLHHGEQVAEQLLVPLQGAAVDGLVADQLVVEVNPNLVLVVIHNPLGLTHKIALCISSSGLLPTVVMYC